MEEFNQSMPYILLNVYYGKNTHLKYSIAARYLEQSAIHCTYKLNLSPHRQKTQYLHL